MKRFGVPVNRDKPDRWKEDIAKSVDLFNDWFIKFAPKAFRDTRIATTRSVEAALSWTENLTNLTPALLREHPDVLGMLRMSTCPPIARDRLIGLSGASKGLIGHMEKKNAVPAKMRRETFDKEAFKIIATIQKRIDPDIFVWLGRKGNPSRIIYQEAQGDFFAYYLKEERGEFDGEVSESRGVVR